MRKNAELEVLLKELESFERSIQKGDTPGIVELKSQVVDVTERDNSRMHLSSPRNDYQGVEEGFSKSRP